MFISVADLPVFVAIQEKDGENIGIIVMNKYVNGQSKFRVCNDNIQPRVFSV